jgi:O-antigen/teichoic acid export membrane protein
VLIRQGLPSFTPAIPVVHIMVAASFFISIVHMPIKILIAAGYRWQVTGFMIGCLGVNAAANYTAVAILHEGVKGAAVATAISYFFLFVVMTYYGLSKGYRPGEVVRHIASLVGVFLYLTGALWGVEELFGPGGGSLGADLGVGLGKLATCLVLLSPWFLLAQRRYRALTTIWGLVRSALAAVRRSIRRAPAPPADAPGS